ncbi:MAG TPA: glycosyltransferase [Paracoccaceae bacterium]|nr:glycosyltransferase [Paracoccaceae bacterium]
MEAADLVKFVLFGLTVSSSWGNGHATLWRGLIRALVAHGHEVTFFERDQPFYALNRDLHELPGARLVLYPDWETVHAEAAAEVARADIALVTSYCPDGPAASELIFETAPAQTVFYDMDTPVTLAALEAGERVEYLPPQGLGDFDLVLSYTGSEALTLLRSRLGARRAAPLYGHVDPELHRPAEAVDEFRGDLSYIGTYAEDRQEVVERLFVEPARARPDQRFVLAGSGYDAAFPWADNIYFVKHLPPPAHPAFYASARLTLNATRRAMAAMGWCPSGRLFEAASCGVPILSDCWEGLDAFFQPGEEILTASTTEQALEALSLPMGDLVTIARRARARVLEEHSSDRRAADLLSILQGGGNSASVPDSLQKHEKGEAVTGGI